MSKCSNCKYGIIELMSEDREFFTCLIDNTIVPIELAENDDWECDLYVEDMDADC